MATPQTFEERFSYENLLGCDDITWKHAQHWARSNAKVAAAVHAVKAGYAEAARQATEPTATGSDSHGATNQPTAARCGASDQVRAMLASRGWAPSDGPAAA